jgi:hypothetical protein
VFETYGEKVASDIPLGFMIFLVGGAILMIQRGGPLLSSRLRSLPCLAEAGRRNI